MEKKFELDIKITTKDLFSFMIHHTNTSFSGIFGLILSIGAFVLLFTGYAQGNDMGNLVLLFLGLCFTVINPVMMYKKAMEQVKNNPLYRDPLHYVLDETGVSLVKNDRTESIEWGRILKFKKTSRVFALYTTGVHAVILPTEGFKEQKEEVEAFIQSKVKGKK